MIIPRLKSYLKLSKKDPLILTQPKQRGLSRHSHAPQMGIFALPNLPYSMVTKKASKRSLKKPLKSGRPIPNSMKSTNNSIACSRIATWSKPWSMILTDFSVRITSGRFLIVALNLSLLLKTTPAVKMPSNKLSGTSPALTAPSA